MSRTRSRTSDLENASRAVIDADIVGLKKNASREPFYASSASRRVQVESRGISLPFKLLLNITLRVTSTRRLDLLQYCLRF